MGDKLFQQAGGAYLSMMKTMKVKLKESSAHYTQLANSCGDQLTAIIREADDCTRSVELDARSYTLQTDMKLYTQSIR